VNERGHAAYKIIEKEGAGFAEVIRAYYERYRAPVFITETSAVGTQRVRSGWLEASIEAIKRLRGEGVPVLGYTWFPLLTMVNWSYRRGTGPMERYKIELGLYKLGSEGERRWHPTPLVAQMQSYIADPEKAIGHLVSD
jgi:beta-glucosidase/6-phospho-beta-glucosidase/beta-galactosidase